MPVIRPVITSPLSVVAGLSRLTISIENSVDALLMAAPTELINAASNAAMISPFRPTGTRRSIINGKVSFVSVISFPKRTKARVPGKRKNSTGSNFKNPVNIGPILASYSVRDASDR